MVADGVFTAAFRHHEGGRLKEAERLYWQILVSHPNHSDNLHLLRVIAQQMGCSDLAIKQITDAIAHNGSIGAYHSNLGVALNAQGRLDEAVACYRRALELTPDSRMRAITWEMISKNRGCWMRRLPATAALLIFGHNFRMRTTA